MPKGPRNDISDVPGIMVGAADDHDCLTGVTVILPSQPAIAACDVRGGGPGTRETDLLDPATLVERVDAIVLSGGSSYGLAAADGVAAWLGSQGRGFRLAPASAAPPSPIVPAAILYDLSNGGNKNWGLDPPYRRLGLEASSNALKNDPVAIGCAGAGRGARSGDGPGGLGSASFDAGDGLVVGALAAVNSFGSARIPGTHHFWAAPFEIEGEFGGFGLPQRGATVADLPPDTKLAASAPRANTTIAVVAVNADLTPAEARRVAIMAQDGLARAIRPAHAPTDGDVVFVLATGGAPVDGALGLTRIGTIAGDCLARAIARGVYEGSRTQTSC